MTKSIEITPAVVRLAFEPGVNPLDHLGVVIAKPFLGDVTKMRRQHDIVELAEGMIDRQRFDREHVDGRTCDFARLQRFKQRGFIHDRPPRSVDEEAGRLHSRQIVAPDKAA